MRYYRIAPTPNYGSHCNCICALLKKSILYRPTPVVNSMTLAISSWFASRCPFSQRARIEKTLKLIFSSLGKIARKSFTGIFIIWQGRRDANSGSCSAFRANCCWRADALEGHVEKLEAKEAAGLEGAGPSPLSKSIASWSSAPVFLACPVVSKIVFLVKAKTFPATFRLRRSKWLFSRASATLLRCWAESVKSFARARSLSAQNLPIVGINELAKLAGELVAFAISLWSAMALDTIVLVGVSCVVCVSSQHNPNKRQTQKQTSHRLQTDHTTCKLPPNTNPFGLHRKPHVCHSLRSHGPSLAAIIHVN